MDKQKICPICKKMPALKRLGKCRECRNAYMREWSKNHPKTLLQRANNITYQKSYREKVSDDLRNKKVKKLYGLSYVEYNELFDRQGGRCAICGKHQSEFKISLSIDHHHETGRIRSLLCSLCNTALGLVHENINTLNSMIEYIRKNKI